MCNLHLDTESWSVFGVVFGTKGPEVDCKVLALDEQEALNKARKRFPEIDWKFVLRDEEG